MTAAITQLYAGVPVSDLDVSIDWYTRFFARDPDLRAGDEVLWDLGDEACLFIEPNRRQAGAGRITLAVTGLDELLERLAERGIRYDAPETYPNGARHVTVPDPDGNAIAYIEPPAVDGRASEVASAFTDAIVGRDIEGAVALLHPEIDFRAMTPNRIWEAPDRAGIEGVLRTWFEAPDEEVELIEARPPVAVQDTVRVGWRVQLDNGRGPHVFEQLAYVRERDGRVGWLRVMCSGPRPLGT